MEKELKGDNIIFIGMPAVGKSTVGVLLAKRVGYGFIDTDLTIQSGEQRRLHQIIDARGMSAFCDLEASYVQRITARRSVIATGGSVVYRHQTMAYLANLGTIVFLDIELDQLRHRLVDMEKRGVVCLPGQTIDDLFSERRPLYRKYADAIVSCGALQPDAVAAKVTTVIEIAA